MGERRGRTYEEINEEEEEKEERKTVLNGATLVTIKESRKGKRRGVKERKKAFIVYTFAL